ALGRVMVFCPRIAQVQRRCTEGAVEGPPLFDGGSVHRDGSPARMVRRLGEVEIILTASKAWKHKGPCPSSTSQLSPAVIVLRNPAHRRLRIDRRAAADPTPLEIQLSGLNGGASDLQRWPVILRIRKEWEGIGALDLEGSLL